MSEEDFKYSVYVKCDNGIVKRVYSSNPDIGVFYQNKPIVLKGVHEVAQYYNTEVPIEVVTPEKIEEMVEAQLKKQNRK